MKPKANASAAIGFTGGEDEKMNRIVDEVDRFFKSVHADIEDWKFSMEDYGDGTRIFVRFQIHINKSGGPSMLEGAREKKPTAADAKQPTAGPPGGTAKRTTVREAAPTDPVERERTGTAGPADSDLASFVELWRRKRESNVGGEYHKPGAPYMDEGTEWRAQKRGGVPSTDDARKRTHDDPGAPDASR